MEHRQPAQETIKKLDEARQERDKIKKELSTNVLCMAKMQSDIEYIKEEIKKQPSKDEMRLAFRQGLEEYTKECDKKYASKLTEKIVHGMIAIILVSVMYLILDTIGIK